jgi:serine/threonine protein kinase
MHDEAPSLTPQPGDVILGRYRIERILGTGGMGVVVAARHLALDSLVAIKFLLPDSLQNAKVVTLFAREARAAARIKSEHVVRVMDVGTLPSGAPYMVMEFLEGSDLAAIIRARGPLPANEAIDYILQACEAIAEAHNAAIVHRDLKPANLFLSRRADGSELVKILDFGISKMVDTGGSHPSGSVTSTSAMLGSPVYMSPEQLNSSRDVDARTDIWALGIILYELLSGRLPFQGESVPQLCVSVLQAEPLPLTSLRPDLSPGLQAAIFRCIQKDRGSRFATVGELADALAVFAGPSSRLSIERVRRLSVAPATSTTQLLPMSGGELQEKPGATRILGADSSVDPAGRGKASRSPSAMSTGERPLPPKATARLVFGAALAAAVAAVAAAGLLTLRAIRHPEPPLRPVTAEHRLEEPSHPVSPPPAPTALERPHPPLVQALPAETAARTQAEERPAAVLTPARSNIPDPRRRRKGSPTTARDEIVPSPSSAPSPGPPPAKVSPPPLERQKPRSPSDWETDRN